ncbi:hypothetical protein SAMN05216312_110190 [Cohnella sp. OV330]|uniref:hypothetical protein n=1 Tax=Cohnella sp. OV330 TaxID=1855288 RepID=UPI0008EAE3F5|nr:hypothetical protein [Cohnella sp. OV330]SFB50132.1 hypothetical protein SAMN05216312_110190 [Cohnella sp. OV330]
MSGSLYLLTICLPLATLLLIFGMRYFSAIQQAKLRFASDEAYRQLAERAVAGQTEAATALASIEESLSDLKTRVGTIEKVLQEVG